MKHQKYGMARSLFIGLLAVALGAFISGDVEAQCPAGWTSVTFDWNGQAYPGNGNSILVGATTVTFANNAAYTSGTPAVTGTIQGGTGGNTLQLQHNGSLVVPALFSMTFSPNPVQGLTFTMLDVDCAGSGAACATSSWRDEVTVTSTGGSPVLTGTAPVNSVVGNVATGNNSNPNDSPNGNVGVAFVENVPDVTLSFANLNGGSAHGIAIRSFSFCQRTPTQALVTDLTMSTVDGAPVVEWTTASEIGALGFHVMRREARTGEYLRVNDTIVPALLNAQGGAYRFVDETAERGKRYSYKIVEVTMEGNRQEYGPFVARDSGADVSPAESAELRRAGFSTVAHALNAVPQKGAAEERLVALAAQPRNGVAKLGVREDGLYFVTSAEMAGWLGLPEAQVRAFLRVRQLSLRNLGGEVAWYPAPDQAGLYFYGQATTSPYTRDNVYWLQQAKLFRGAVMPVVKGSSPAPTAGLQQFVDQQRREQNKIALTSLPADPASDFWYWEYVGGTGTKTFPVSLDDPAEGTGTATVRITGRGTTTDPHPLRITVNGFVAGEVTPVGTARFSVEVPVAQSALVRGSNDVVVTRVPVGGAGDGGVFVDAIEVVYARQSRAVNDALSVLSGNEPVVTVTGFTDGDVRVVDITDPRAPSWVSGVNVTGSGERQASFAPATAEARYYLASTAALRKPAWAVPATASTLKDPGAGAAYIVIAPAGFEAAAEALAAHRSALGARVVSAEAIYDEFGHGMTSPEAIRSFLAYAWESWKTRPRYVALLGNGTFDYRNYWGNGDCFLPPMMTNTTPGGLLSSDNALADVDGDGVPEMAIGRIPIVSNDEGLAYVRKLAAHEASSGPWAARALMSADKTDAVNYTGQSEAVSTLLPAGYQKSTVYLSQTELAPARQSLIAALNDGVGLFNYLGHGGTDRLAKTGLLTLSDVPALVNQGRFPVLSALTCVLNRFEYPGYSSLGEQLTLKETGGAIAVWSSSGFSFPEATEALNAKLFEAYATGRKPIGDVVLGALRAYADEGNTANHLKTYTLIGDPAVTIAAQ